MRNNNNPFDIFSSKIKKIYIELPDFSFYHGVSEDHTLDERIIGRKKIKNKLREVIINNDAKSGAYLVTGYRGMGKSSFVSSVIYEICYLQKNFQVIGKLLLYYFIFLFFTFLKNQDLEEITQIEWILSYSNIIAKIIFIVFFTVSILKYLYYLLSKGLLKYPIPTYKYIILLFFKFIWNILNPFVIRSRKIQKHMHIDMFQIILINSMWGIYLLFYTNGFVSYQECSFVIYSLLTLKIVFELFYNLERVFLNILFSRSDKTKSVNHFYKIFKNNHISFISDIKYKVDVYKLFYEKFKKAKDDKSIFIFLLIKYFAIKLISLFKRENVAFKIIRSIWNFVTKPIKNQFRYGRNIFIKINLGYDDLKEKDILRLVTVNLNNSYKQFINSSKKSLYLLLFVKICIFISLLSFLRLESIKKEHADFIISTGIDNYLPFYSEIYKDSNSIKEADNDTKANTLINISNNSAFIIHNSNENNNKSIKIFIQKLSRISDFYIQTAFDNLVNFTNNNLLFELIKPSFIIENKLNKLDYSLIVYYIITVLLLKLILRSRFLNITTYYSISKKLELLNKRIYSGYTEEKGKSYSNNRFAIYSFFNKKSHEYPIADVREIENNLIDILNDIQKLSSFFYKPNIVFIFDELDKIEPQSKIAVGEKENEIKENETKFSNAFSPSSTRERQQSIQKLLSNLKFFLTTAKAKFIFIAGREMYDAALADVSDRNFFIGSIFHDVIYVDSFLTDPTDKKESDASSMVEQYVCQALMPYSYKLCIGPGNCNLKSYTEYLMLNVARRKHFSKEHLKDNDIYINDKTYYKLEYLKPDERVKYEKLIVFLYHFIVYLTHSSNGAPKKITTFFEKHIEFDDDIDKTQCLYLNKNSNSKYFLAFDVEDQFKIGLIHYLASPIILSILNRLKGHDDKLLVSSSFLVDHIFKYSRNGFSWRNIENTPELIEINKTPELRGFISDIIHYLNRMHIQEMVSGLYTYSFTKKIMHEISYISKISEEASATFNFTLDESLAMKQFYNRMLSRIQERYKLESYIKNGNNDYIHSIASIHIILGDMYFYDEEYNDAIVEYMDGIQVLRKCKPQEMNPTLMVLLVRNMLKLGLAYEKRKTFNSAYLTFSEITSFLIEYRDIDISKLGLEETIDESEKKSILIKKRSNRKDILFHHEIKPEDFKNTYSDFPISEDDFSSKILDYGISPLKEKILNKISTFEGIRLIYQPLLAKLQIIEKSHLGGIKPVDIFRVNKEFDFLQKAINKEQKFLISCDFKNKVGNILFYKNSFVCNIQKINIEEKTPNKSPVDYKKTHSCELFDDFDCLIKDCMNSDSASFFISLPCYACRFYFESIKHFIINNRFNNSNSDKDIYTNSKANNSGNNKKIFKDPLEILLCYITREEASFKFIDAASYTSIAGSLSDLGDTILSCYKYKDVESLKLDFILILYEAVNLWNNKDEGNERIAGKIYRIEKFLEYYVFVNKFKDKRLIPILKVFTAYYISAQYYKKADNHKFYLWQYTKILYLIIEIFNLIKINDSSEVVINFTKNNILKNITNFLTKNIIIGQYNTYHDIHRSEILKIKEFFNEGIFSEIDLKRSTVNTDLTEVSILVGRIELILSIEVNDERKRILGRYFQNISFSPYGICDTIYNRILRLSFKARLNYMIMETLGFSNLDRKNETIENFEIKFTKNLANTIDKQNINNDILDKYFNEFYNEQFSDLTNVYSKEEKKLMFISHLITDSIFCLLEVIKMSNSYGISYMMSHSYIGLTHDKLIDWCAFYNTFLKINHIYEVIKDRILDKQQQRDLLNSVEVNNKYFDVTYFKRIASDTETKLKQLIGADNMHIVSTRYHAELAIDHLFACRQVHSGGNAYKNLIENMSYLNDDFCDKQYHFCAALERFYLINGKIKNKLDDLFKVGNESGVFKIKNYASDPLNQKYHKNEKKQR